MKYNIVQPQIDDNEINNVIKVLRSGMLVESKNSREFESKFAEFTGTKRAILTSSGTTALHLAFEGLDLPVGAEVITSSFTFIASSNSILMVGGVPVFADIDEQTLNLDPEAVEKKITDKTRAIMPVHIFGLPANMKRFKEIADEHDLLLIEDAAQAHGSRIDGQHVGSFGDVGCFSLYATKNMISGEGGVITTNNEELADKIESLKNHGRGKEGGYKHYRVGYNFRITDFAAAIALEQLKKLPKMVKHRQENHRIYRDILEPYSDLIRFQEIYPGYEHCAYVCAPIIIDEKIKVDDIITELRKKEIGARTIYSLPVHKQPAYSSLKNWRWSAAVNYRDYSKEDLPITMKIASSHFEIPGHPGISEEDAKYIGETLVKILLDLKS